MNYRKMKKEIKKNLDKSTKYYDSMESESAPSGEWEEYNYHILVQEAVVDTWEQAYEIVKNFKKGLRYEE